jgi:hypothetical protein
MDVLRCPTCGAPAPPFATRCAWCDGVLVPPPLPPGIGPPPPPPPDPLQGTSGFALHLGNDIFGGLRVEAPDGSLLGLARHSREGLVAFMETIVTDPYGRFLLALRLKRQPGHPFIQGPIPYLAVDDQGQVIGELSSQTHGLSGRSYALSREGVEYLSVPEASANAPYPILNQGNPVAIVTESKPMFAKQAFTTWTVVFGSSSQHLHVLALMLHVAKSRGAFVF